MIDLFNDIDTQFFLSLNRLHHPVWDKIMWIISGKATWIPLYLAIIAYIVYKFKNKSWLIVAGFLVLILIADQISSGLIKPLVERLRPSHQENLQDYIHLVNNYKGGRFGFVSSHAANSFAFAWYCSLFIKNKIFAFSIFTWAALVSYSRIYLGVHYPGDILGGIAVGIFAGYCTYWLLILIWKKYPNHAPDRP